MALQYEDQSELFGGQNLEQEEAEGTQSPMAGGGTMDTANPFQTATEGVKSLFKNKPEGGGGLGKGLGKIAGTAFGGPVGGMVGSMLGGMLPFKHGGEVKRTPRAHDNIDNLINIGGALEGALQHAGMTKTKARFAGEYNLGGEIPIQSDEMRESQYEYSDNTGPMQQATGKVPSGMGRRILQQAAQAGPAKSGRYAEGGEVPIIAHEGEWVLNQKQQNRLKKLTGMNKNSLFDILGIPK